MKRDIDLIRRIMLDIEEMPPGARIGVPVYDGVERDVVIAHAVLLHEAGLVKGSVMHPMNGPPKIQISGLTWEGHDFLAVAKNDTIWEKAKRTVLAPAAGATWAVVLEWMKAESMKAFGLSS